MECRKCRENCQNFGMRDIIEYVREFFEVEDYVTDKTLREKIISVIGAEAWEASERKIGQKRTAHFFTQDELQKIVFETPLYDYLLERASERARIGLVQGAEFREWWRGLNIGVESYHDLASRLVDLAFNLCNDVYADGRLPPLPKVDSESEEKIDIAFELLKKALIFYPQYADRFGGESEAAARAEEKCQVERISDRVVEKLAPMFTGTEPQPKPPEEKPPSGGKHGTFRD